jgi:hypothetical protein
VVTVCIYLALDLGAKIVTQLLMFEHVTNKRIANNKMAALGW